MTYRLLLLTSLLMPAHAPPSAAYSSVGDIRTHWRNYSGWVLQAASAIPEERYAFRPTAEVRTMAELLEHVASSQVLFCAMVIGEKAPSSRGAAAKGKAELVDALNASNALCERAYAISDSAAAENINVLGQQHSRMYALTMNAMHTSEHYGNVVTYMRLNGLTPPSSPPRK